MEAFESRRDWKSESGGICSGCRWGHSTVCWYPVSVCGGDHHSVLSFEDSLAAFLDRCETSGELCSVVEPDSRAALVAYAKFDEWRSYSLWLDWPNNSCHQDVERNLYVERAPTWCIHCKNALLGAGKIAGYRAIAYPSVDDSDLRRQGGWWSASYHEGVERRRFVSVYRDPYFSVGTTSCFIRPLNARIDVHRGFGLAWCLKSACLIT